MKISRSTGLIPVLLTLALSGIPGCASDDDSSPGEYHVLVDLYSGRANPDAELSARVAGRIYGELDERAGELRAVDEPTPVLGFRGFVVTPRGGSLPVLRVTRDSLYADRGGRYERLADPAGRYYNLVLDDVRTRLPPDVTGALA